MLVINWVLHILQTAAVKPKCNLYMLCLLLAKNVTGTSSEQTSIRNMQGNILHTMRFKLGRKRLFCKSTEKNIHCYTGILHVFTNEVLPKHCIATTYLSCCLHNKPGMAKLNGKIMLIQPEETLVKLYQFPLQQPEFVI